jgi:hypothetical protein
MAKLKKRLALDTNLLFDLASGSDIAHSFREAFQQKGYLLEVGPTVLLEAHYLHEYGTPAQRRLATTALAQLLQWKIQPFNLRPVEHGIAEQFCLRLHRKKLLPDEEINDGLILAETALAEIPVLVTSDKHLLHIEESQLRICFDDADLSMVSCFHPRRLVQALR